MDNLRNILAAVLAGIAARLGRPVIIYVAEPTLGNVVRNCRSLWEEIPKNGNLAEIDDAQRDDLVQRILQGLSAPPVPLQVDEACVTDAVDLALEEPPPAGCTLEEAVRHSLHQCRGRAALDVSAALLREKGRTGSTTDSVGGADEGGPSEELSPIAEQRTLSVPLPLQPAATHPFRQHSSAERPTTSGGSLLKFTDAHDDDDGTHAPHTSE